jgi:hypothetical protein
MLFLQIFLFAAAVPLLARLKLPTLEPLLRPRKAAPPPQPKQIEKIITLTDTALRFGKPLIQVRCLTRGLTLYYFLQRVGFDVTLQFGATNYNGQFAGHCWLEKNGDLFSEPTDPRSVYVPVYCFPGHVEG